MRLSLTRREKEFSAMTAQRLKAYEIAGRMFVSPGGIEIHRLNFIQNLRARNAEHVMAKEIRMKLDMKA